MGPSHRPPTPHQQRQSLIEMAARGHLRNLRDIIGMSLTDAANMVGIDAVTYAAWERGALPHDPYAIRKFASVLAAMCTMGNP